MRRTLEQRLWSKVDQDGPASTHWPELGPCWLWLGTVSSGNRYGAIHAAGRMVSVHRLIYGWRRGPIPAGLELDHLCRNTRCVRPEHLEAVTHAENMRRGAQAREVRDRGYRCKRHDEAMIVRGGIRVCRSCRILANREYRARKRVAA